MGSQNRRCAKNESVNLDIPRWGSLKNAAKVDWTERTSSETVEIVIRPERIEKGERRSRMRINGDCGQKLRE